MEIKKIEDLTRRWKDITWTAIRLETPDLAKIGKLFIDTYNMIDSYKTEKLVPKEISGMLLEMLDFSWWVGNLDDTPIHYLYQEIVSIVYGLNKYFLTQDANVQVIEESIERLSVG